MKQFKPSHGQRRGPSTFTIGAVVFSVLFIWFAHNFFSGILFFIAEPFLATRTNVVTKIDEMKQLFTAQNDLVAQNKALQDELTLAKIRLSDFEGIKAENDQLKALGYKRASSTNPTGTLARVLATPALSPYDTLIIDSGASSGIVEGSQVRVWNNKLIGFVTQVFPSSAIVTLLSSPDQKIDVRIGTTTPGIAYGRGAGNFIISLPKDAPASVGDRVGMPLYGETLGTVLSIESNDESSMKNVYLNFPFSVFTLDWVLISPPYRFPEGVLGGKEIATTTKTVGTTTSATTTTKSKSAKR